RTRRRGQPHCVPLAGAILRWKRVGDEATSAYPGIYLDGKTRISVGVGGQYQPRSGGLRTGSSTYDHYIALAADLFADVALTPRTEAVLAMGGYRFDYGEGDGRNG